MYLNNFFANLEIQMSILALKKWPLKVSIKSNCTYAISKHQICDQTTLLLISRTNQYNKTEENRRQVSIRWHFAVWWIMHFSSIQELKCRITLLFLWCTWHHETPDLQTALAIYSLTKPRAGDNKGLLQQTEKDWLGRWVREANINRLLLFCSESQAVCRWNLSK